MIEARNGTACSSASSLAPTVVIPCTPRISSRLLTRYASFATVPPAGRKHVGLSVTHKLARPEPQALAGAIEALAARFGNRLVTSQAVRDQHAHTTTWLAPQP